MSALRIFSYLPNPRIWKATIAARLCGVEVEVRGAPVAELENWLWDFQARTLTTEDRADSGDLQRMGRTGFSGRLYKTESFLEAHPFGTVPAAFSRDGKVGIFESNSIMRAVARLGGDRCSLYGSDAYTSARIDSFLDVSLVFARDVQLYILALRSGTIAADTHARAQAAFGSYMAGIDRALACGGFIAGADLSLADICFVAEVALLHNEFKHRELLREAGLEPLLREQIKNDSPRAMAHFGRLCEHPAFAPDAGPYMKEILDQA